MHLNQVTLPSVDLNKSIPFYQVLGLRLIVQSLPEYARFVCPRGNATLSLSRVEQVQRDHNVQVYFECEDLDQRVQDLVNAGISFDELPTDKRWRWREARLRDPDENQLILFLAGANRINPPWRIRAGAEVAAGARGGTWLPCEIVQVPESDKLVLRRLMELYCHDLSAYVQLDVDQNGLFGYRHFEAYWTEPGRHPFFIKMAGKHAGFALVNSHCIVVTDPQAHAMAEFFIMKKYRRSGLGRRAAIEIFNRFPGKWEVTQVATNVPAVAFWEAVIDEYTRGQYETTRSEKKGIPRRVIMFETGHTNTRAT